jgi:hypothetical protein
MKTYKQKLLDLIQDEIKDLNRSKSKINGITLTDFSKTELYNYVIKRVSRLQTYKLQVRRLPATVVASSRFPTSRHSVINSIYLFNPEIITKLYDSSKRH